MIHLCYLLYKQVTLYICIYILAVNALLNKSSSNDEHIPNISEFFFVSTRLATYFHEYTGIYYINISIIHIYIYEVSI